MRATINMKSTTCIEDRLAYSCARQQQNYLSIPRALSDLLREPLSRDGGEYVDMNESWMQPMATCRSSKSDPHDSAVTARGPAPPGQEAASVFDSANRNPRCHLSARAMSTNLGPVCVGATNGSSLSMHPSA